MHRIVNDEALDTLFRGARSHYSWHVRPVSDAMLRALWELVKFGPTSGYGDESQFSPDRGQPGAAEACRIP